VVKKDILVFTPFLAAKPSLGCRIGILQTQQDWHPILHFLWVEKKNPKPTSVLFQNRLFRRIGIRRYVHCAINAQSLRTNCVLTA